VEGHPKLFRIVILGSNCEAHLARPKPLIVIAKVVIRQVGSIWNNEGIWVVGIKDLHSVGVVADWVGQQRDLVNELICLGLSYAFLQL